MSRPNSQPAEDDDSINFMESVSSFKSEDFPSSDHEDRKTIGKLDFLSSSLFLPHLLPSSLFSSLPHSLPPSLPPSLPCSLFFLSLLIHFILFLLF